MRTGKGHILAQRSIVDRILPHTDSEVQGQVKGQSSFVRESGITYFFMQILKVTGN